MKQSNISKQAFTLVELLATIAILAVLSAVAVYFTVSYSSWAQQTTNTQTLAILNQALGVYKTLGGMSQAHSLEGTNTQSKINVIVETLKTGFTVGGEKRIFLPPKQTIETNGLYVSGAGPTFQFSGYGDKTNSSTFAGTYNAHQVSYRHLKITFSKRKANDGPGLQFAELKLYSLGSPISWPLGATSFCDPVYGDSDYYPLKIYDNDLNTKWYVNIGETTDVTAYIIIDAGNGRAFNFDSYQWATANDCVWRDPVSWVLSGSNNGINYTILDTKNNFSPPTSRMTWTSIFTIE